LGSGYESVVVALHRTHNGIQMLHESTSESKCHLIVGMTTTNIVAAVVSVVALVIVIVVLLLRLC